MTAAAAGIRRVTKHLLLAGVNTMARAMGRSPWGGGAHILTYHQVRASRAEVIDAYNEVALDRLEEGPVIAPKLKNLKLPAEEIYVEVENPRGQLGFYVLGDGSTVPARVKARGPSFCNLSIATHICRDILIADMPAIIGSIDMVMGEVDR